MVYLKEDKIVFGWGHDKCNFCTKIRNPFVEVDVINWQTYRSTPNVNMNDDAVRVTIDFNIKNNRVLYNILKRLI